MLLSVIEFSRLQIYIYIFLVSQSYIYSIYQKEGIYTLELFKPLKQILI